ncbi:MAG: nuclear transport factor 2 family protein [Chloroflexi bacterium]|nr:nuclear transport factor 2 family protein [Chloroflexota bacterium]
MTTARENGIRLVQESVAGENAQDYDRMYAVFAPRLTFFLNGDVLASGSAAVFREAEKKTTPATWGDAQRETQWIDATDDRVVYQYRLVFQHNGEVFGFPASGNRIEVHGMAIGAHDGEAIHALRFFTDQGEMNRQLSGQVRTPGRDGAAATGPAIAETERARMSAIGERLIRTVYETEAAKDVARHISCYADPLLDHQYGRAMVTPLDRLSTALERFYAANPTLRREVEEVINTGNRSTLRWHLTAEREDGEPISQHGCSVIEHDGEKITKFWAYYPDLVAVFPAILQLI